jgi:hypothetical protein
MGYSYRLDAGIGRARVEDPGARSLVRTAGPGDQSGTGHADHTCREPASVSFAALRPGQANRIPGALLRFRHLKAEKRQLQKE